MITIIIIMYTVMHINQRRSGATCRVDVHDQTVCLPAAVTLGVGWGWGWVGVPSLPHYFGVLADDVQLEHISAFNALDQPQRHLWVGWVG